MRPVRALTWRVECLRSTLPPTVVQITSWSPAAARSQCFVHVHASYSIQVDGMRCIFTGWGQHLRWPSRWLLPLWRRVVAVSLLQRQLQQSPWSTTTKTMQRVAFATTLLCTYVCAKLEASAHLLPHMPSRFGAELGALRRLLRGAVALYDGLALGKPVPHAAPGPHLVLHLDPRSLCSPLHLPWTHGTFLSRICAHRPDERLSYLSAAPRQPKSNPHAVCTPTKRWQLCRAARSELSRSRCAQAQNSVVRYIAEAFEIRESTH